MDFQPFCAECSLELHRNRQLNTMLNRRETSMFTGVLASIASFSHHHIRHFMFLMFQKPAIVLPCENKNLQ
jgi:hypothetical protein